MLLNTSQIVDILMGLDLLIERYEHLAKSSGQFDFRERHNR
jgi:hypothetical protein